jgi:transcription initiation factor TFIIIB Brf1 subunit/transcription initiation factor TFIIB
MAAVLQGVVSDVRGSSHRRVADGVPADSRVVRAAATYVASRDRQWPFSFENLCEALSLEPRRLRRVVRKAIERAGAPGSDAATPIRRRD